MKKDTTKISDIDEILNEEMKNPSFVKAWQETELEDQIKRMIIQTRIDENLTQKDLAKKSGIKQSYIVKFENGESTPSLKTLNTIASAVGRKLKIEMI